MDIHPSIKIQIFAQLHKMYTYPPTKMCMIQQSLVVLAKYSEFAFERDLHEPKKNY